MPAKSTKTRKPAKPKLKVRSASYVELAQVGSHLEGNWSEPFKLTTKQIKDKKVVNVVAPCGDEFDFELDDVAKALELL